MNFCVFLSTILSIAAQQLKKDILKDRVGTFPTIRS